MDIHLATQLFHVRSTVSAVLDLDPGNTSCADRAGRSDDLKYGFHPCWRRRRRWRRFYANTRCIAFTRQEDFLQENRRPLSAAEARSEKTASSKPSSSAFW